MSEIDEILENTELNIDPSDNTELNFPKPSDAEENETSDVLAQLQEELESQAEALVAESKEARAEAKANADEESGIEEVVEETSESEEVIEVEEPAVSEEAAENEESAVIEEAVETEEHAVTEEAVENEEPAVTEEAAEAEEPAVIDETVENEESTEEISDTDEDESEETQENLDDIWDEEYDAENIGELYGKYSIGVMENLEPDRYFHYLYNMITAGENEFHQTNQILRKTVDETWLEAIENTLDSLNHIIDHPRRFIKNTEEIVPVALAKKITGESVRHLSQNTQFINFDEEGNIQPSKILNVTVEETYDLYENRFVYHLIQKLVRFIDKRTDVIFWSTGDEIRHKLQFTSHVDDAYERIDYKVEMEIKNLQSFAESDTENLTTFMRIDRVRRLVLSLKHSAFCDIMNGCAMVRSPIQRTNLLIKDPDYKKTYQLWQFIEKYDDVGYTINAQDNTMAFDQEYVHHMFSNMITNYTVFKSLIEVDDREVTPGLQNEFVLAHQNKEIKPKFIKEIKEEIVENRDLPDVEVRRIFVEEVTEAQVEAELAAEQAKAEAAEARAAQKEAEHQIILARHDAEEANEQMKDAKFKADNEATKAAEAIKAKEVAEAAVATTVAECNAATAAAQEEAQRRIAEAEENAKTQIEQMTAEALARAEKAETEAETKIVATKKMADELIKQISTEAEEKYTKYKTEAEEKFTTYQTEAEAKYDKAIAENSEKVASIIQSRDAVRQQLKDTETSLMGQINTLRESLSSEKKALAESEQNYAELEEKLAEALETIEKYKQMNIFKKWFGK